MSVLLVVSSCIHDVPWVMIPCQIVSAFHIRHNLRISYLALALVQNKTSVFSAHRVLIKGCLYFESILLVIGLA